MDLTKLNINDAVTYDTFGGASISTGAHVMEIIEVTKNDGQSGTCSLNFKFKVNGAERYSTLWLKSKNFNTGNVEDNVYDSRRFKQLLYLLSIRPTNLTEEATNNEWSVRIPQIKGEIGVVLEVVPANATKPNKEGKQYPKYNLVSFYDAASGKTLKENVENLPAELVNKEVEKLQAKTYKVYDLGGSGATTAPKQFDASPEIDSSDLPF